MCLPTADASTISLSVPDPGDARSPWLLAQALDILRATGRCERAPEPERFVAGRRRGAPLVAGETIVWSTVRVTVAAVQSVDADGAELTLHLPSWDALAPAVPEDRLWALVDDLAAQLAARMGIVSDGAQVGFPDPDRAHSWVPRLWRRHLGVLLPPPWLAYLGPSTHPYRVLDASGLVVALH